MKRDILILIMCSVFILFFNLWAGSLSSWDEAFYAHLSREIAASDNPVDFIWGNTTWTDKPLLYMWVTAIFYKLFGVNEFSARLFSCICGIGTVILTYLFAARIFSRRTGMLAAFMLLSTYHFVWFSKMGTLDIAFTLFLFASIYSFLRSERDPLHIVYSFLWFTIAFLVKGVGAFLIPMILGLYILTKRQWNMAFNRHTAFGIFIFLFVAGGWYFVRFLLRGQIVLEDHFYHHLIKRTMNPLDGHHGNWLTYINVVLYKGKPWGACGLLALPFFVFHTLKKRQLDNCLLISWVLVVFLVFTLVRTKLHWYIIPVYPALAIVAARGMETVFKRGAAAIVVTVSLASLFYFGLKKDIFTLDFNPEIKKLAETVTDPSFNAKGIYFYNIGDPAMRFYFGQKTENIPSEAELLKIARKKDAVIIIDSHAASDIDIQGEVIPSDRSDIKAIRIK